MRITNMDLTINRNVTNDNETEDTSSNADESNIVNGTTNTIHILVPLKATRAMINYVSFVHCGHHNRSASDYKQLVSVCCVVKEIYLIIAHLRELVC